MIGVVFILHAFLLYGFAQVLAEPPASASASASSPFTIQTLRNALWLKGIGQLVAGCITVYLSITYQALVAPMVLALALQCLVGGVVDLVGGSGGRGGEEEDEEAVGKAKGEAASAAGSSAGASARRRRA